MPVSNLYRSLSCFGIFTCSFECSGSLTTMLLVVVVVVVVAAVIVVVGDLTHSTKIGCRLDCGCLFPGRRESTFFTMFKLSPDQDELGAY